VRKPHSGNLLRRNPRRGRPWCSFFENCPLDRAGTLRAWAEQALIPESQPHLDIAGLRPLVRLPFLNRSIDV